MSIKQVRRWMKPCGILTESILYGIILLKSIQKFWNIKLSDSYQKMNMIIICMVVLPLKLKIPELAWSWNKPGSWTWERNTQYLDKVAVLTHIPLPVWTTSIVGKAKGILLRGDKTLYSIQKQMMHTFIHVMRQ